MMTNQKTIDLLSQDMQDEHAAIIQYLSQAYAIGEGELACELEAIAREEMQHFRWLAERIVALGGKPDMQRGKVVFGGPKVVDMLQADIEAEQTAIAHYREHIAAIGDPTITIWLERIIADETAHLAKFEGFKEEQDAAVEVRMEPAVAPADAEKTAFLQKDATHEYTVVLQYLGHAFTTPHCEVEHELEYSAVEEMLHMGWLAEKMESLGGRVEMVHDPLELPADTSDMLKVDIAVEERVASEYRRQARAADDARVSQLLNRLAGEEDHHIYIFSGLLDAVQRAAQGKPTFTIGSLLGEKQ